MNVTMWEHRNLTEIFGWHSSPSIIKMTNLKEGKMGRTCSMNDDERSSRRILVEKPEGKRLLERPRSSWVDNIKIYLSALEWGGMDSNELAQDRDQ
jgi:hypothetical protein